jgi:hypothetical protein
VLDRALGPERLPEIDPGAEHDHATDDRGIGDLAEEAGRDARHEQDHDERVQGCANDFDDLREQARGGELVRAVLVQPAPSLRAG